MKKFILKILTAGEGGVGKTTLLHRYVEGKFSAETRMTIGVEFFLKEVNIDSKHCTLQLWDFGGQQRFRFLLESYVLGAKGALLLFDLTRPMTLEKLEEWVTLCRRGDPDLPILFLGTKNDLTEVEDVKEIDDYVLDLQDTFKFFDYLKISSKSGENVHKAFELLTTKILDRQSY